MKFTNTSNLSPHVSKVLEAAYLNDAYDAPKGDQIISVTGLIAPAQKRHIEKEHAAELSMDVIDTVPALLGQALHHILERAGPAAPTHVPERRLSTIHNGWTISGKTDLYETEGKMLLDYKNSSVWTYVFGKVEWIQQLNVYRWLSERNGFPVNGLGVVLFCGDWRRGEAKRSPDYPARVVDIPIPLWTMDETEAFVDKRLALHEAAQAGKFVECSDEERWAKKTTYAVMRAGRKTAVSLHETWENAQREAAGSGLSIVTRPGESVRCNGYCPASVWCLQWAKDETNPANVKVPIEAA